jgi:hypothetical protein
MSSKLANVLYSSATEQRAGMLRLLACIDLMPVPLALQVNYEPDLTGMGFYVE